jgi:hypothetical protein
MVARQFKNMHKFTIPQTQNSIYVDFFERLLWKILTSLQSMFEFYSSDKTSKIFYSIE